MTKKKVLFLLLALFACLCFAMAGCSANELTVTITNKESLTAEWSEGGADRTIEFTVTRGGEAVEDAEYTISSDNSGVVSVDGSTLKAVSAGSATVTVASGEASDSVKLTVSPSLNGVAISNKEELAAAWHVGEANRTVELTFDPTSFNAENTDAKITSSDDTVISVNGMSLKAEKVGKATITVTAGGHTDSVALTVRPALDSVTVTNKTEMEEDWVAGASRTLALSFEPSDYFTGENTQITVLSDPANLITADGTKLTLAGNVANGTQITVTVSAESVSTSFKFTATRTAPSISFSGVQPSEYYEETAEGGKVSVLEGTQVIMLPTVSAAACDGSAIEEDAITVTHSEGIETDGFGTLYPAKGTYTVTYTVADPIDSSLTSSKTLTIDVYRKVYTDISDWWLTTDGLFAEDNAQTATSLYPNGYALGVFKMQPSKQYYAEVTFSGFVSGGSLVGMGHFEDGPRAKNFVNVMLMSDSVADNANSFRATDLGDNTSWTSVTGKVVNYTKAQMVERGIYPENLEQIKFAVARDGDVFYCFIDDKFVTAVKSADFGEGYFGNIDTIPGIFGYNYAGVTVQGMQYCSGAEAQAKVQGLMQNVPVEVEITNKAALTALWEKDDADRTVEFTITRGGLPVENAEYEITANVDGIVEIDGVILKALSTGIVTITLTCGDASDSVEIVVGGDRSDPTISFSGVMPEEYFQSTEEGGTIGVLEGTEITLPAVTATSCDNEPIADIQAVYSENLGTPSEGKVTPPKGTHTVTYTVTDPIDPTFKASKTLTINVYRKVFADGAWMKTERLFAADEAQTARAQDSEYGVGVFNMQASKLYYAEVTFKGEGGLPGMAHFVDWTNDQVFINVFLTTGGDSNANSFRATQFGPVSEGWGGITGTIKNITRGQLESQGLYPQDLTNVKFAIARNGNDFYCFVNDKLVAQMTCEYMNDKDTTPGIFGYNYAKAVAGSMQYYGGTQAEGKIQELLQS